MLTDGNEHCFYLVDFLSLFVEAVDLVDGNSK